MDILKLIKNKKELAPVFEVIVFSGSDNRLKNLRIDFAAKLLLELNNRTFSFKFDNVRTYLGVSFNAVEDFLQNLNKEKQLLKSKMVYITDMELNLELIESLSASKHIDVEYHELTIVKDNLNDSVPYINAYSSLGERVLDESFFSNTILDYYFEEYSKTVSRKTYETVRKKTILTYSSFGRYEAVELLMKTGVLISLMFDSSISVDDLTEMLKG